MLLTAIASVFFGMLPGYITFEWNSISYLFKKCIEIAILTAFSILPLLAVAAAVEELYTPCMCDTGLHLSLALFCLWLICTYHPLSSATAIIMRDIPRCYFGTGSQYSGCTFLYRYMDYCFYRICVHFLKA